MAKPHLTTRKRRAVKAQGATFWTDVLSSHYRAALRRGGERDRRHYPTPGVLACAAAPGGGRWIWRSHRHACHVTVATAEPTGFGLSLTNAHTLPDSTWQAVSQASRTCARKRKRSPRSFYPSKDHGIFNRNSRCSPSSYRFFERIS